MSDLNDVPIAVPVPEIVTVRDLAVLIDSSPIAIIKQLMANGVIANINQQIDYDTAAIVAEEMGCVVEPAETEGVSADKAPGEVPA